MRKLPLVQAIGLAFPLVCLSHAYAADDTEDGQTKSLGVVVITGSQPTSLPTQIPTTMESSTGRKIQETVNATDSEDALKYFPSLLVRKRYIGDYNHAILSTRASGTGNSARSMVFADGILLSNFLGNGVGGITFPPRWGMVTPEEIERVDVMYGPFSAAYAGNSVGAVVDYVTRMPTKFESHFAVGMVDQPFKMYNTDANFKEWQTSASVGSRSGDLAWWLNFSHTDSEGQPLTFATRLVSNGVANSTIGTPVTGAVLDKNNANQAWYDIGTGTQYHSKQDHLKAKLAYDVTPTVRATYTLGLWQNKSDSTPISYLRDVNGQPVYSGAININGTAFYDVSATNKQALTGSDFVMSHQESTHYMHGLSVKSHTKGIWDWDATVSLYDYQNDQLRQNGSGNPLPNAAAGGAGTIADGHGTGWNTLAGHGVWRPYGLRGEHIVDFGVQQDSYKLAYLSSTIAGNWLSDSAGAMNNQVQGKTQLRSLWGQDAWAFAPAWKTVLGLRMENWSASDGQTNFSATSFKPFASRSESFASPKAAVSYQWLDDTVLKTSVGRAVRFPTVSELYGATSTTNSTYINDPNLRPEKSWTNEISAEKALDNGVARLTFFAENTRDSIYSQSIIDPAAGNKNISRVQNVDYLQTRGVEAAYNAAGVFWHQLDLNGSVTYADSKILENAGYVNTAGDTIGKQQPNIPKWRATALASWHFSQDFSATLGARYSGVQYRTLNNSDVNGSTYMGVSKYFTTDVRVVWHLDQHVTTSAGIDNLNNYQYWNFHPYPQRSYSANLRADF